jgi:hypothetical protein
VVLPQPGRAEHGEELARRDVHADAVDGDHLAEPLDQIDELDLPLPWLQDRSASANVWKLST